VVDPDIADAILANSTLSQVTNDYVEATVLFIDIVGFTGLCEELAPKQIVSLLNQYYFYINEVAKRCRGSVDKFVGDGAMVLFGAPQPNEQHAYDAVRAGLLFLALFADLAKTQNKQVMPVKVHLGVHTGRMLAGILGSKERMHYTLVGDNVNLGARLCEMADPEQLVISDAVLKHSSVVNKLSVSTTGSKKLKGKSTNVSTYQVAGLVESQEQQWITNQCQQLVNIEV
jgi:adenylate cyclase